MSFPSSINSPPATHDLRAEQPDKVEGKLEVTAHFLLGQLGKIFNDRGRINNLVAKIEAVELQYKKLDEAQLHQRVLALRHNLHVQGLTQALIITSFALTRELSHRTIGLRHYGSQLTGGLVILQGMVAEMETGEGKTLAATLPAVTAALAGIPVHIVSVNDYLTARDAENMSPLYQSLGLSVGYVVHGRTPAQKRQAYQCDITYATNKELVFDYLRDRLTLAERLEPILLQAGYLHGDENHSKRILLRGLHFAIIDEADSILIDEARTPLIISGGSADNEEKKFLQQALELADNLSEGDHYSLDLSQRQVRFSEKGKQRVEAEVKALGPLWSGVVRRESTVQQALSALHFFKRDDHYLLIDGKIQIVDEFTGRMMEDRTWEQGLHQLIELKEGCDMTQRRETLAKISYQRFFRRYLHLSGMTGTAKEVAGELWSVYRLPTLKVPTHRPIIRKRLADRVFASENKKWEAVVVLIGELHHRGQPILVGTRSVAASEHLAELVRREGLPCQILNARQDVMEAEIIGKAGAIGSITIATNMAGRGTDIMLGAGVRELGGLYVIATERHEAARIDRQLAGRCSRQGDPGCYQAMLSLDDLLLEGNRGGLLAQFFKHSARVVPGFSHTLARWAIILAQFHIERHHALVRNQLFKQDQAQGSLLSFSGLLE